MKKLMLSLALGTGLLMAQTDPTATTAPTGPSYTELVAYLGLTPAQLTALQSIQTGIQTQARTLQTAINTDQTNLNTLLAGKSPSAAAVGQLEIDIYNNRAKIAALNTTAYNQAIGVLTLTGQAAKLAALQAAANLAPTLREASMLNLLTPSTTPGGPGGAFGPRRIGGGMPPMGGPGSPMDRFAGRNR